MRGKHGTKAAQAKNAQVRLLRRHLWLGLLARIALFSAIYFLVAYIVDRFVLDYVGEAIADATSSWITIPAETVREMEGRGYTYTDGENWQYALGPDGTVYMRDITIYKFIRALKIPLFISFYLVGCIIIVFWMLNRSTKYFGELSDAVESVIANKDEPVALSPELSVTESKLNALRLRARSDEEAAIAAEERKNEMVAYLAHDIRTPLTSVLGYLGLLAESPDLPRDVRSKYTVTALEKAERLEGLVEEFFEITRYNLQSIPIERERVNISLFLHQVADELFPQASERGLSIQVSANDDAMFFVDGEKLARAVGNVVRNAIAFADPGSAVLIACAVNEDVATITISDEGREIAPVHLEAIFQKFFREDGARASREGGAGLGLAIAQEIVTAHGGTIRASSVNGITTFTIELPLGISVSDV